MEFIDELRTKFQLLANKENATAQKAYMKNKFEFFGLKTKERDAITKDFIKNFGLMSENDLLKLVKQLYSQPERDFHYTAIDLVAFHKKNWNQQTLNLIEFLLINNSWWDSVDDINSVLIYPFFTKFPELIVPITTKWNKTNNIWLQRSSIIFQNKFKKATNKELLAQHILNCSESTEFFIQKAIGWSLRSYGAVNKKWVLDFVENNKLPALSKKEALRKII